MKKINELQDIIESQKAQINSLTTMNEELKDSRNQKEITVEAVKDNEDSTEDERDKEIRMLKEQLLKEHMLREKMILDQ